MASTNAISTTSKLPAENSVGVTMLPQKRPQEEQEEESSDGNWVLKKVKVESEYHQQFKPLEEDHIEQMIEELLHYGSIELCCNKLPF